VSTVPQAFSPEADAKITEIVARYPMRMAALIPVLYLAQKEFGYLTAQVLSLVARRLDVPEAKVVHTATFYTMLHKRPIGRHHVQICHNIACYLRGADRLFEVAEHKLGIRHGETTADHQFTLWGVECLAACGTAPCAQINEEYHENLTPERLGRLLDSLGAPAGGTP
jgi:NADH-quinone oxidoreductase E subunit